MPEINPKWSQKLQQRPWIGPTSKGPALVQVYKVSRTDCFASSAASKVGPPNLTPLVSYREFRFLGRCLVAGSIDSK